jgi:hypothetical protein
VKLLVQVSIVALLKITGFKRNLLSPSPRQNNSMGKKLMMYPRNA